MILYALLIKCTIVAKSVGGGGGGVGGGNKKGGAVIPKSQYIFFQIISCASVVLALNIPIHGIIHIYNRQYLQVIRGGGGSKFPHIQYHLNKNLSVGQRSFQGIMLPYQSLSWGKGVGGLE